MQKPDLGGLKQLRFVTEDDYPPFNFALPNGELTGFNVELARAICEELEISCTIQRRKWELLIPALNENAADAVVASLASTPENRAQVDFTDPYYLTPGRFVALSSAVLPAATPEALTDRKVAVVAGSTHEAYLKTFFPKTEIVAFETPEAARTALKNGHVNALFGDAVSLSFWLNGADADGLLRLQERPLCRRAFLWRRRRGRGQERRGSASTRPGLCARSPCAKGRLQRALSQIFPDWAVLSGYSSCAAARCACSSASARLRFSPLVSCEPARSASS